MASLKVLRPGMLTTVQDLGRWGYQSSGVPVAGPMDVYSHRRANRLAGNPDAAAALELTIIGPEVQAAGDIVCAVAGAEFIVTVDRSAVDTQQCFDLPDGSTLRLVGRGAGARATLAVRGGFDLPPVFGSRATGLASRMGAFGGRALRAGDELPVGITRLPIRQGVRGPSVPLPRGGARVRVLMGPHDDRFDDEVICKLLGSRFSIAPESNRMGYRLGGPALPFRSGAEVLSEATPMGSIQVTGSGQPILLMADRQTTGGYPRIATVISADLPIAGQLAPGDWIEFSACSRDEALDALREQELSLEQIR
jgi:biotin-dependent carboxylase-like uncharacterized protein